MRRAVLLTCLLTITLGLGALGAAQDVPPVPLATNTPNVLAPTLTPPPVSLATNTPPPGGMLAPLPPVPGPLDFYALRLWTVADLTALLEQQLALLIDADDATRAEHTLAVELVAYELERRFPAAYTREAVQVRLLPLLRQVPPGTMDMGRILRPAVARALSDQVDVLRASPGGVIRLGDGLSVNVTAVSATPATDREYVLAITLNDPEGSLLYRDVIFAWEQNDAIEVVPGPYVGGPYDAIQDVRLLRVGDLNNDGAAEFAVQIRQADRLNDVIQVFGFRGDTVFELTAPGAVILATGPQQWPANSSRFTVTERRATNDFWNCYEVRDVTWEWGANRFVIADSTPFTPEDSLACTLLASGNPYFVSLPAAIANIESALADAPVGADLTRAQLVLATLYVLDNRRQAGLDLATVALNDLPPDDPRALQAQTLIDGLLANEPPLVVCDLENRIGPDVICDVDALLARIFLDAPLLTNGDIRDQLEARGLTVLATTTVNRVGQRQRQAAQLDLQGGLWVAFSVNPADDSVYLFERIDAPEGFVTPTPPPAFVDLRPQLREVLLLRENATAAISAINTIEASYGTLPAEFRFVRALSHDLAGNREQARAQYYTLWTDDPGGLWGMLAARHLERR